MSIIWYKVSKSCFFKGFFERDFGSKKVPVFAQAYPQGPRGTFKKKNPNPFVTQIKFYVSMFSPFSCDSTAFDPKLRVPKVAYCCFSMGQISPFYGVKQLKVS
jgi:hypothetical protein